MKCTRPECDNQTKRKRQFCSTDCWREVYRYETHTCARCNNPFRRKKTETTKAYCSKECRFHTPTWTCVVCNQPFCRKKESKYCSKKCFHNAAAVVVKCDGKNCDKEIRLPPYKIRKKNYCSTQCRVTSVPRSCARCKKPLVALPGKVSIGAGKYCSTECSNAAIRTGVEKTCEGCKKPFYVNGSKAENGRGKYCSRDCLRESKQERTIRQYVFVFRPLHPQAKNNGWVSKARILMEEKLKRILLPSELVKYRDGNPKNLTIENLVLVGSNTKPCATCKKPFRVQPSKAAKVKYCSRKCGYAMNRKTLAKWVKCFECKGKFKAVVRSSQPICGLECQKRHDLKLMISKARMKTVFHPETWKERGLYKWEIAEEVGCTVGEVSRILKELGMDMEPGSNNIYKPPQVQQKDPRKPWKNLQDVSKLNNSDKGP